MSQQKCREKKQESIPSSSMDWLLLLPGSSDLQGISSAKLTCKKMGSDGGVPATSLMIKSAKGWRRERRELAQLGLHTFPSWESLFYTRISP